MNKLLKTGILILFLGISVAPAFIQAIQDFDGDYATIPPELSESGMYSDFANKVINPTVIPYDVNVPYWVDGTHKKRWIWLPAGASITPTDTSFWDYPEGTVIAKNFYLELETGVPSSEIAIETRLLVKRETRWRTISYEWQHDQSRAVLYNPKRNMYKFFTVNNGGVPETFRWQYPNSSLCTACHNAAAGGVIGITAPNLNMVSPIDATKNQLVDLFEKGVINANVYTPELFAYAGMDHPTASNEVKSRSWFYMNCAYCHSDINQQPGASHDFGYYRGTEVPNYMGNAADPSTWIESYQDPQFSYVIRPGYPDSSRFLQRMMARGTFSSFNPEQMPPYITFKVDTKAVETISAWICEMDPAAPCNPAPAHVPVSPEEDEFIDDPEKWLPGLKAADEVIITDSTGVWVDPHFALSQQHTPLAFNGFIQNKSLHVTGATGAAALYDVKGMEIPLTAISANEYLIRGDLPNGLYLLKSGSQSALVTYYP